MKRMNLKFLVPTKLFHAITSPDPLKTISVAASGLIMSDILRGLFQWAVLVGTAVIVNIHVVMLMTKVYCPARRLRELPPSLASQRICARCPLCGTIICPFGIGKEAE